MKPQLYLVALLMSGTISLFAQEPAKQNPDDQFKIPVFGLGIKTFNLIAESTESPYLMPGNRVIMTVNAFPNFRAQPEFGMNRSRRYSDNLSEDLINISTTYGLGLYGMWRKDKTLFYIGPKWAANKSKATDENYTVEYNPNPPYNTIQKFYKLETLTKTTSIGLISGGEYLLGKHFSLGAEVAVCRQKLFVDYPLFPYSSNQQKDITVYTILTETNLLVRYYF